MAHFGIKPLTGGLSDYDESFHGRSAWIGRAIQRGALCSRTRTDLARSRHARGARGARGARRARTPISPRIAAANRTSQAPASDRLGRAATAGTTRLLVVGRDRALRPSATTL